MKNKLKKIVFWKFLNNIIKPFFGLFIFALSISAAFYFFKTAQADNLSYIENFTATTYEDSASTTGKWDTALGQASLLGNAWANMSGASAQPDNLSNNSGDSQLQDTAEMVTDSTGNPYIIWVDQSTGSGDVYFSKWNPIALPDVCGSGITGCWTNMAGTAAGYDNISNDNNIVSPAAHMPDLRLDASNNPSVVWVQLDSGIEDVYFSKWDPTAPPAVCGSGITGCWTNMAGTANYDNVSQTPAVSQYPDLQLDSLGNPYIVWNESLGGGDNRIYFSKWDSIAPPSICGAGITGCWTNIAGTAKYDNLSTGDAGLPLMKFDLSDNPMVVWHQIVLGAYEVFFSKWNPTASPAVCGLGITGCWTNMAGTTLGIDNLSNTVNGSQYPKIATNAIGMPYVVWEDYQFGGGDVCVTYWDGGKWAKLSNGTAGFDNVSNDPNLSWNPQIKMDLWGRPNIYWTGQNPLIRDVYYTRWNGSAWTGADGITPGADNVSNSPANDDVFVKLQFDSSGNPILVWSDRADIYISKWTPSVLAWTKMDDTFGFENVSNSGTVTSAELGVDLASNPIIVWDDQKTGNYDIYAAYWKADYNLSSQIQSLNVNSSSDYVASAKLTATQTLSGQTINYYLSNDGGTTWEAVNLNDDHTFSSQGTDLRWRAVLATTSNTVTPVIDDLQIIYQTRKLTCGLSPSNLTVGQSVTINAQVTFVPTSVWATVENNGNLLSSTTMSGSGGNYSADITTNANYYGQNDVAVFASDGTHEYTCNPSTGAAWQKLSVNDMPWTGRYKFNMVSFKNKLWILGGGSPSLGQSEVWSSQNGTNWQLVNNSAPWGPKRSEKGAIVFNNKLWLMGGFKLNANGSALTFQNDVWSSSDGVNWTQETAAANWSPRSAFSLSLYNNKLWLSGGCFHVDGALACDDTKNDVWSSSDGINWTQETANAAWTRRAGHKVLVYDDGSPAGEQLWLMGGISYPGAARFNDVWSSPDGINWTQVTTIGPIWETRSGFEALVYNNGSGLKMWLMGGFDSSVYHNDVWSSGDGINWTLEKDDVAQPAAGVQLSQWTQWSPRSNSQAVVFNDGTGAKLWLAGGSDIINLRNDIWNSSNGVAWTLLNQNYDAEFSPRFDSPMIEYNGKLWLIGGFAKPTGISNDVWSSTDGVHWDCEFGPYTIAGGYGIDCHHPAPGFVPRFSHKLLVYNDGTGDKLWLIGGCNDTSSGYVSCPTVGGRLRDVWSFDGTTWTQKTPTAAWPGRYEPAVAVFNNKMWLLGGGSFHDVWSSSNGIAWSASPNAAWSVRIAHSAISFDDGTGSKLWVMGGYSSTRLNDVWYSTDPTTGTWVQATSGAAWAGRYTFGLLVNNDKMWIFGGNKPGTSLEMFSSNEAWWSRDGVTWTQATANAPWWGRDFFGYASFKNRMILSGGDSLAGTQNDVWASSYDYLHFTVGNSPTSPGVNLPVVPSDLKCTAQSNSVIRWNFTDNANNETGFKLRDLNGVIQEVDIANQTSFDETGLQTNTQYQNRQVTAFNNGGESDLSNPASCYTLANQPLMPIVSQITTDSVVVKIDPGDNNPANTEYAIKELTCGQYVQADGTFAETAIWQTQAGWGGDNGIEVAGTPATVNSNSNVNAQLTISLAPDTSYDFAVIARNGDGVETALSSEVNATTNSVEPAVPSDDNTNINTPPPPDNNTNLPPTPPTNTNTPPITPPPPSNINVPPVILPPGNINLPPITPPSGNINVPITPPGGITQLPVEPQSQSKQILGGNETAQAIVQFLTSPQVKKTSQNVVTPILLGLAAVNTLPTAIILTTYLLPYLNLLFIEPLLLFFRKKRKKWGIVYDSLTKLPIGLALVRLYSQKDNKLVQTKVTDKEGRYIMLVNEPGKYYIKVTKPGYEYPTRYLKEDKQDTKYVDLYHGEALEVKDQGVVVTANIPIDPVDKKVIPAAEAIRQYLLNNLRLIISYLGVILALIVVLIYQTPITIGSLIFHIIMFVIFRRLITPPKPKSWGIVYDEKNKQPLHYALVRILDTKFNKLLETQVTDAKGRYSFLVGKNEYQLLAEKAGYQPREIKPVDLINKETVVDLDVGLKKV